MVKNGGIISYAGTLLRSPSPLPRRKSFSECCSSIIAAEQKARVTYDNILRLSDDPDVNDAIKFLRQREVVHFQRFGEANHTDLSKKEPPGVLYPGGLLFSPGCMSF